MRASTRQLSTALAVSLFFGLSLLSCSESPPAGSSEAENSASAEAPTSRPALIDADELPTEIAIADPEPRIKRLEVVEDYSEAVANRLLDFSADLRKRSFRDAAEILAPEFAGHALAPLDVASSRLEHGDVTIATLETSTAPIVGRKSFVESLETLFGSWERVESMLFKVKGAEFQAGGDSRWGKIRIKFHGIGIAAGGAPTSFSGWANLRAERMAGEWFATHFALESMHIDTRPRPFFTNVATSVGVAHTGIRFGKEGNQSYAFNGAATADVDGDGRYDIFVPSDGRNFLYMAQSDGTYREEAKARGVHGPDAGTGPVFFDYDNDGDIDLMVGHVGWMEKDKLQGRTTCLYENDGKGKFTEIGAERGLDLPLIAYSLTVLDYDADGWLDVFVCGYGQVEHEHNNSWIEATNGAPNALLRNLEGKGFRDVAAEAGVRGTSWSYAAAIGDIDEDGDADLYVANDYGTNRLYQNQGDGTFVDVADAWRVRDQGNGMGVSIGDLTGDGKLDLYVSNMSSTAGNRILGRLEGEIDEEVHAMLKKAAAGNTIFVRASGGEFRALESSAGGVGASWAWASSLADIDLDGDLDVFCTNGFVTGDLAHDT